MSWTGAWPAKPEESPADRLPIANYATAYLAPLASGTPVANPIPGDCRADQCDGSGNIVANAVDNSDLPADDGNQCTSDTCSGGSPMHTPRPAGDTCSQSGGSACDGNGNCVQCLSASDCGTSTANR